MRTSISLLVVIAAWGLSTGCYIADDAFSKTVEEEKVITFRDVEALRLTNVTGNIEVTGWDKDSVEVSYRKHADSHSTLPELRIDSSQNGGSLDIEAHFPPHCRRCSVSFKVFVPRTMAGMALESTTGSIALSGMGHIERTFLKTVTGSVKAALSGRELILRSTTGSIRAELDAVAADSDIQVALTTGSINLLLPDDYSGHVSLETATGRVSTDFPVTMPTSGNMRRNTIYGSVGEGAAQVRAVTVTGSVRLMKR